MRTEGAALSTLESLSEKDKNDFDKISKALIERFNPENMKIINRTCLFNTKMKQQDNLDTFTDNLLLKAR